MGGVETVRLEPLNSSSLESQSPGVETRHQSSPAGGTLGTGVGLGQQEAGTGETLVERIEVSREDISLTWR